MKITAVPTEQLTELEGVPVRVWHAETEDGVRFLMFVHRVAVPEGADASAFERELETMPTPRVTRLSEVFDARLFLD